MKVRRFVAIDDCGNIINPMIVEGQVHGGLTEGFAIAFMQEISYDESGNVQGGNFMDYLLPTTVETPKWETGKTCTPSPHHPFGPKGVGESPNVGSPAAFVNAVVDALYHLGVKHIMPNAPQTPEFPSHTPDGRHAARDRLILLQAKQGDSTMGVPAGTRS